MDPVRALSRLEPLRWLAAAAVDWAAIALTFVIVAQIDHPVAYALALVPLGSRQQALGALFHDASHHLVSGRRWHNDLAGSVLAAWPLGLTLGGYRRYHFAHHRHLGSALDPENQHKGLLRQWRLPARPARALGWFFTDLVGGGVPHLLAAGKLTRPTNVGEAAALLSFWAGALGLFWALDALWVPGLWVTGVATIFWSGVRLRIWTEHLGTRSTHRIAVPAWVAELIMPHDIGMHWEHHHHPTVPFYNLGALRAAVAGPPVVSLRALGRAFVASPPLASGQVAETVCPRPAGEEPRRARRRALAFVAHVLAPLGVGAATYLVVRPHDLVAYAWLGRAGARLSSLEVDVGALRPVTDALPSALFAYALAAVLSLIWSGPGPTPRASRRGWLAAGLVLAIGWEVGQAASLVGGHFAWGDLLATIVAFAAAVRYASNACT